MKIEILTRNETKRPAAVTFMAGRPGLSARGEEMEAEGIRLETGEGYLYFTISSPDLAEEVVRLLFSPEETPAAHSWRPATDQKIVITARARPIEDIVPALSLVEHLNLEDGELAGQFNKTWASHDVAVTALSGLMVQGGVAVARVRFVTHARDSEYYCRACIGSIALGEVLAAFTAEPEENCAPPAVGPIIMEASGETEGNGWAEFVNGQTGASLSYDRPVGELMLRYGGGSAVSFRAGAAGGPVTYRVHLDSPARLTPALASRLREQVGVNGLRIGREIKGIALDLDRLRRELGFRAGGSPGGPAASLSTFHHSGDVTATYDAGKLEMRMEALLDLTGTAPGRQAERFFAEIEALTLGVLALTV